MSLLMPVNRRDCLNWGIGRPIHPIATALVCRKLIYLLDLPIFQTGGCVVFGEIGDSHQFRHSAFELQTNAVLWTG